MKNKNLKEIDAKYASVFKEVGLDIREYCICKAKPDGACGFNCTALNYHHDETLGSYVRMNVNNHIDEHILKLLFGQTILWVTDRPQTILLGLS